MTSVDADFFARQVDYLVAAGHSRSVARAQVQAVLPEPMVEAERQVAPDALEVHLAALRGALGPALPEVACALRAFRAEVAMTMQPIWHSWRGQVLHMAMLAVVAVLVAWMMGIFVLPRMEASYQSFGAALQPATRFVLTWSDSLVLPAVFGAPALVLWWLVRQAQSASVLRLTPSHARSALRLLGPAGPRLWAAYEITVARAALAAGFEPNSAIDLGLRFGKSWHGTAAWDADGVARARAAARLGTLAWELPFQRDALWHAVLQLAGARRQWLALATSLVLGAAVGLYVIALYLPIFTISSVI